ncbi:MAG: hypothetical protein N4A31_05605 [Rickettsiales bacterium]|jgi:PBP1b-binding outer membrane lipoprotein LpoB|nr:hypothetical protein [Rickettsiales bacterium]
MSRILLIITALFLVSCSSSVNKNFKDNDDKKIESMITAGVSTKQDIRNTFGEPTNIEYSKTNHDKWTYEYSEASNNPLNYIPVTRILNGQSGTTRKMVILFNGNVVDKYALSSNDEKVSKGVLTD